MRMTCCFMLLGAVALVLIGCGGRIVDPKAQVVGVEATEQTAQGTAFELLVRVDNPNDIPLPLLWSHYRVAMGDRVFRFAGPPGASLPPSGSQTLTLKGSVPNDGRDLIGRDYEATGGLVYQKPGAWESMLVESGFPEPRIHFQGKGTLEAGAGAVDGWGDGAGSP